jgi:hypothetical protein
MIQFNCDYDSNEIDESDLQYKKHHNPRNSTFRGMLKNSSHEFANVFDLI